MAPVWSKPSSSNPPKSTPQPMVSNMDLSPSSPHIGSSNILQLSRNISLISSSPTNISSNMGQQSSSPHPQSSTMIMSSSSQEPGFSNISVLSPSPHNTAFIIGESSSSPQPQSSILLESPVSSNITASLPKNVSIVKTPGSYNLNQSSDSESELDIPPAKSKGIFLYKSRFFNNRYLTS